MSEIKPGYLPTAWEDEDVPVPRESPEAWLVKSDEGHWQLRIDPDSEEYENAFYTLDITEGQVVHFSACEDHGDRLLTVHPDGRYEIDRAVPDDANTFWLPFDVETVCHSLEELVREGTGLGDPLPPGDHVVNVLCWYDSRPYVFQVEDGQGKFVRPEAAR